MKEFKIFIKVNEEKILLAVFPKTAYIYDIISYYFNSISEEVIEATIFNHIFSEAWVQISGYRGEEQVRANKELGQLMVIRKLTQCSNQDNYQISIST